MENINAFVYTNNNNEKKLLTSKQFGNPLYDIGYSDDEPLIDGNQYAKLPERPKPRERITVKRKQRNIDDNAVVYTNVPIISSNDSIDSNDVTDCAVNTAISSQCHKPMTTVIPVSGSDDIPTMITELETILHDIDDSIDSEPFTPKSTATYNSGSIVTDSFTYSTPQSPPIIATTRPQPAPRPSLTLHASSTSTSSSSLHTRPLPEPPRDIPPPKPPHLPPDRPPPPPPDRSTHSSDCSSTESCSPPPLVPPRLPAPRDTSAKEYPIPRKMSEPSFQQKSPIGIARSQTVKMKERPSVEKKNLNQIVLKPLFIGLNETPQRRSGYLWKTGSGRKEFLDRWCVLHRDRRMDDESYFGYYIDRKSSAARGKILLKDVSFIRSTPSITSKTKLPSISAYNQEKGNIAINFNFFEIGINSKKGRVYLFAAKCVADQKLWISSLSQAIACKSILSLKDIEQCGYLRVKHGIAGQWMTAFVILNGRVLIIIRKDSINDRIRVDDSDNSSDYESDDTCETYDIRKVMSIAYASVHQISSCSTVSECGQPLCLTLPQRVLYLQSEFKMHTDLWYQSITKCWSPLESNGRLSDQYLTNDNIPVAIDKCLNFVSTYGLDSTSLYVNINLQSSIAQAIVSAFLANPWEMQLKIETVSVHDVTTAMIIFLRSMTECILTEKLYHNWIKANEFENRNERLDKFKLLLRLLPTINYVTLKRIIAHLVCVIENSDKNQLSILNLAPVICQAILFLKVGDKILDDRVSTFDGESAGMDIISDFILSYGWLFDVSTQELEKERKIQRAMEMLKHAKQTFGQFGQQLARQKSVSDCEEFLIGVYIYNKTWGKCLNVRLTPTMTAADLIDYAVKQARIKDAPKELAVFEIVCDDQLERVLHYSDIVLGVTLSWVKWSESEAKQNYLCIKRNQLYEQIMPHISDQTPITIFSELRYADKSWKVFKKVLVEFIGAKLSLYKDAKAEKCLGQWNIEDITWYLGAEKKRLANNAKLSITFIEKNVSVNRSKDSPYFGRTICCNTEQEHYRLISGMLCAEYPNGILSATTTVKTPHQQHLHHIK